jgi:hypothetical protein
MARDDELENFKRRIDLREYAADPGYTLDRRDSWRGSAVMRNAADDKVAIKRDGDGHYVYSRSATMPTTAPSSISCKNRKRLSLGAVREELPPWIGRPTAPVPIFPALEPRPKTGCWWKRNISA